MRKIEIFTAGCPVCEPAVQMVNELVCSNCQVTTYNMTENNPDINNLVQKYGVTRLPFIVVDGQPVGCCKNVEITKQDLIAAGIGQS